MKTPNKQHSKNYFALSQVRENVRNALKQKPHKYNTLKEALARVASQFQIPMKQWTERSSLLTNALFQKRLTDYFRK